MMTMECWEILTEDGIGLEEEILEYIYIYMDSCTLNYRVYGLIKFIPNIALLYYLN